MKQSQAIPMYALLISIAIISACSPAKNIRSGAISQKYIPIDNVLYATIIIQDSILFDAFNSRNIDKLESCFTDNLEVYQDNTGVRNYEQTIESFKELFRKDYVLTRKLIKESVEIYPIKDFGAIETGRHTFCHTENGKLECATFKFLEIWEIKNGQWKIAKIITYDHKM
jgi:hypothetical protein